MHEASLVQALFDQIAHHLRAHPGAQVRSVHVVVGRLAGVEPELFRSAFDLLKPAGPAPEAELALREEAERWTCPLCGGSAAPGSRLRCPDCDVPVRLTGGGDVLLERLELEVPDV